MALSELISNLGPGTQILTQSVTNKVEAATEDSKYWGDWLTTPQGVAWSFKQQGLQLANPKTEGNLLTLTKLFNPLNVPSNALTAFAGTRLPRHGFFGIEPSYENVVKGKATLGVWNLPIIGQRMVQLGYEFNNVPNVLTDRLAAGVELPGTPKAIQTLAWISGKALQIKDFVGSITGKNPILTVSGLGGPNSLFGVGSTVHYKSNSGVQLRDYLGKEAISSALDLNKSTYIGGEYGLNKYSFLSLVKNKLDITFANEQEVKSLINSKNFDDVVTFGKQIGKSLIITRGEHGSVAIIKDEVFECNSKKDLNIRDLTGAGDLFAAGFLHGQINNLSTKVCLEKGTEMSSKIIQKIGARLN